MTRRKAARVCKHFLEDLIWRYFIRTVMDVLRGTVDKLRKSSLRIGFEVSWSNNFFVYLKVICVGVTIMDNRCTEVEGVYFKVPESSQYMCLVMLLFLDLWRHLEYVYKVSFTLFHSALLMIILARLTTCKCEEIYCCDGITWTRECLGISCSDVSIDIEIFWIKSPKL